MDLIAWLTFARSSVVLAESSGSTFPDYLVSYGVAAPLVAFMWWVISQRDAALKKQDEDHKAAIAAKDEEIKAKNEELLSERDLTREMGERLLEQQKELLPMVSKMKDTLGDAVAALTARKQNDGA